MLALELGFKVCAWSIKSSDHVATAPCVIYESVVTTFFLSLVYMVSLTPRYAVMFRSHRLDLVQSPSNSSTLSLSSTGHAAAMFTGDGGRVVAGEVGLLGKSGGGVGVLWFSGAVFTGGGNSTGGTRFARLTAARWGVIPVCCCSL